MVGDSVVKQFKVSHALFFTFRFDVLGKQMSRRLNEFYNPNHLFAVILLHTFVQRQHLPDTTFSNGA